MAAHEEQQQRVVAHHAKLGIRWRSERLVARVLARDLILAPPSRTLAAHVILEPSHRNAEQPTARIRGNARGGPLRRCGDQCFLHSILRVREITALARHYAKHLRRKLTQQLLGGQISVGARVSLCHELRVQRVSDGADGSGGALMIGRSSTAMLSGTP